ncbi:glycoside hydrolase family 76 protein [Phormidesmis sp. 146-12]
MVVPGSCSPSVAAGMAALQAFYNLSTGLWNTTGWWNSANALETTIDYATITQTIPYRGNVFNTFEKNKHTNFLNPWFYDDEGWWALTWIRAYDVTGQRRYLEMSKTIFENMTQGWDATCGGGIWWHKRRQYKNAITNELFLSIAAKLHRRSSTQAEAVYYLNWAQREWEWFRNTGMINSDNLVNDGLDDACRNNGKTIWTYNQGVILGGLVDLYHSTKDPTLLAQAEAIADAAIQKLAPNGILQEPCEINRDCGADGPQFKGIFMRNLSDLYQTLPKPEYKDFITQNAAAIWSRRDRSNQFGLSWAGEFDQADASRQSSAMDAVNAAILLGTTGIYQAENAMLSGAKQAAIEPGFRGAGYVKSTVNNDSVTFNVKVSCSGKYDLKFRYATIEGNASRYVYANGKKVVDNQIFPQGQTWNETTVSNVWLNAGENTVSIIFNALKGSQNSLTLDEMRIEPRS